MGRQMMALTLLLPRKGVDGVNDSMLHLSTLYMQLYSMPI